MPLLGWGLLCVIEEPLTELEPQLRRKRCLGDAEAQLRGRCVGLESLRWLLSQKCP